MLALVTRIVRLEREHAGADICRVCSAGDPAAKRVFSVSFDGDGSDTPDHCPGCGRRQVFKITFDDRE